MAPTKQPKVLKDLPSKEIRWMKQTTEAGTQFYITSTKDRSSYLLYQQTTDGFLLLCKAQTPSEFNDWIEKWKSDHEPTDSVEKSRRVRKSAK